MTYTRYESRLLFGVLWSAPGGLPRHVPTHGPCVVDRRLGAHRGNPRGVACHGNGQWYNGDANQGGTVRLKGGFMTRIARGN